MIGARRVPLSVAGFSILAAVVLVLFAVMPRHWFSPTTVVPVDNGGFEEGGGSATAAGWTDVSADAGDDGAAFTEAGGATGGFQLSHWWREPYRVETRQRLSSIADGVYRLRVSARSSGGGSYIAMRDCGDIEPRASLPATGTWQTLTLTGEITRGRCTISLVSDADAGDWANFDDVRLERISGGALPQAPMLGIAALLLVGGGVGGWATIRRPARRPAETAAAAAPEPEDESQRRMVADIAHELRTPLSTLRSHLEALIDGVLPAGPEVFQSLHEEALLQQRIVDDLQELTLAEAGALTYRKTPLELPELLHSCRTALAVKAAAAGVDLRVRASERTVVLGDAGRIRQVIGNLLSNALRHTPAGGSVVMDCRTTGGSAVVTVTDTGAGIAEDDLPHVFDRFWRAEAGRGRESGGTGLGLAIARRIVTDHGGDIAVRSSLGHGTTFTIRLPRP